MNMVISVVPLNPAGQKAQLPRRSRKSGPAPPTSKAIHAFNSNSPPPRVDFCHLTCPRAQQYRWQQQHHTHHTSKVLLLQPAVPPCHSRYTRRDRCWVHCRCCCCCRSQGPGHFPPHCRYHCRCQWFHLQRCWVLLPGCHPLARLAVPLPPAAACHLPCRDLSRRSMGCLLHDQPLLCTCMQGQQGNRTHLDMDLGVD